MTERIKKGDAEAFRQLFEKLFRALVYFGLKLTGNQAEAEDIASEAFHQLWLKRENLKGYSEMRVYLFTIVHNLSINYLKRSKMIKVKHKSLTSNTAFIDNENFSTRIIQAETMAAIYHAIKNLSGNQKELLHKIYFEEFSTLEIAKKMGKTQAYVRTAKARALVSLRKILLNKMLPVSSIIFSFCFLQNKF